MKGRPNTPTHLRAVEGNRGKRSLETHEPEPPVIDGDAPAYLVGPALEMWHRLLPLLVKHVALSELDKPKLEMYCASYGRYRGAMMALSADGVITTTYTARGRNGTQIKTRPEYHQMLEEVRLMHSLGAEMGLSPAARARLKGLGQGDFFDELDELNRRYQSGQAKS
jgi:P27 family predicted phage terminase small subunit